LTGKQPITRSPSSKLVWGPCPTCQGTGKVRLCPPETIVIRTKCRPRAGAPIWSDSPKQIADWLGIYEEFVRIAIRGGYVQQNRLRGKNYYRLMDVKQWYEVCELIPGAGGLFFDSMLREAFPGVSFVWNRDLDGYTIE